MTLARCPCSGVHRVSKPIPNCSILKFPSFQFLIINTEFFNFLIFQNQFCSFFIFFLQFLCSPVAGHPGTVNMNMNVDPASSNLNIGVDMKSDYKMNSLEVDSSS